MTALAVPTTRDIFSLSRLVDGYPASRNEYVWAAKEARLGSVMLDFLERFPSYRIFRTPKEFIDGCEALKLLLKEARQLPEEHLRDPQD